MKYFLIFLFQGKVVNVAMIHDKDVRDGTADVFKSRLVGVGKSPLEGDMFYDDVQTLDQEPV